MHGSREGHSTITAVQNIENRLKYNKTKGETSIVLSTDLTNAFDTIDHTILLQSASTLVCGGDLTLLLKVTSVKDNYLLKFKGISARQKNLSLIW